MALELTYVLPVHNEEKVLEANVARLVDFLRTFPSRSTEAMPIAPSGRHDILLIENGSRDRSWELCQSIAQGPLSQIVPIYAYRVPDAGIGYALHRGLEAAVALHRGEPHRWVLLTAADLPFGFSDLEQALPLMGSPPRPAVLVGSKAHPDSVIQVDTKRRVATFAYRFARKVVLGMQTKDSQGTFFLHLPSVEGLFPQVQSRNFFWTTELTHYLERQGLVPREVPVVLEPERRGSTVRPIKHGMEMLGQLVRLRARTL